MIGGQPIGGAPIGAYGVGWPNGAVTLGEAPASAPRGWARRPRNVRRTSEYERYLAALRCAACCAYVFTAEGTVRKDFIAVLVYGCNSV